MMPLILIPPASVAPFLPDLPATVVLLLSVLVGFLMVIVFRYTSDQKAIRIAKDQLKAHLLAVRLFQDQLPVVLSSYVRIVRGTGRYLILAFRPFLIVALPLTFLIVQLDRYLGWTPLSTGQPFLMKAHASDPEVLNSIDLQLPQPLQATAPPVHIPSENEIVWRVIAHEAGSYDVNLGSSDKTFSKRVSVSQRIDRISLARFKGHFWKRFLFSAEPPLPAGSPLQSVEVGYPSRSISFLGIEWNWIWLFFVLSLVAGFLFKSVLGIEI
jgi:hypothetical protein